MEAVLKHGIYLDVSSLFLSESYSDCVIKSSDEKEFKAHRLILAKRTDVFDAMLTTDMKEGNSNIISLPEHSHILQRLLQLIYGLETKGGMQNFMDLCVVTKKYLMMDLHEECLKKLASFLKNSSAIEMIIFAYDNDCKNLMDLSMTWIKENFEEIYKSVSWKLLIQHPEVLNLVFEMYVEVCDDIVQYERKNYGDPNLDALDIIRSHRLRRQIKYEREIARRESMVKVEWYQKEQRMIAQEKRNNMKILNQIQKHRNAFCTNLSIVGLGIIFSVCVHGIFRR